jgi:hypothetical protein
MPTCEDKIPQSPDPFLSSLLKQYQDSAVVSKQGKKTEGRVHLLGRICSAITEYWEDGRDMSTTASEHGWPLEIDFENIPYRLMQPEFKNRIDEIITNLFALNNSVAWNTFLTLLNSAKCNMADFNGIHEWGKFRAVGTNAHAG